MPIVTQTLVTLLRLPNNAVGEVEHSRDLSHKIRPENNETATLVGQRVACSEVLYEQYQFSKSNLYKLMPRPEHLFRFTSAVGVVNKHAFEASRFWIGLR